MPAAALDYYYKWLGIPPDEHPPNYYRLLGLRLWEADADVIDAAANRQMAHIRTYQNGPHAAQSQKLLNEIARARACLLDAKGRAFYDGELKKKLAAAGGSSVSSVSESFFRQTPWQDGKIPQTVAELQHCLAAIGLLSEREATALLEKIPAAARPQNAKAFAGDLVRLGKLTKLQASGLLQGKLKYLVLGEYLLLEKIGQGGMGQVLKAEHRRMKRLVALKVLATKSMSDPDAVRRFQREVEAAARLIHPNIVTAFDANVTEGVQFLVMEFVDGNDLASLLKSGGPFSVEKAVDCVLQAARGLAFAHENGIVHRDIKPGNLLIDKRGTIKILDMGLARLQIAEGTADGELTTAGQIMGTVDYMAPEQALDTKNADGRADIYSLGCTLYRLLAGAPLYEADTFMKKVLAHRELPIPLLTEVRADIPPALDTIFCKMVAKKADERFQTMGAVVAALEAWQKGSPPPLERSAPIVPVSPLAPNDSFVDDDLKLTSVLRELGGGEKTMSYSTVQTVTNAPAQPAIEETDVLAVGDDTAKSKAQAKAAAKAPSAEPATAQPAAPPGKRSRTAVYAAGGLALVALIGICAVVIPVMRPSGADVPSSNGNESGGATSDGVGDVATALPGEPEPAPPVRLVLDLSNVGEKGMAYVELPRFLALDGPLTVEMIATPRSVKAADRKKRLQLFGLGGNLVSLYQLGADWVWDVMPGDATVPRQVAAQNAVQPGVSVHLAGVVAADELRFFVDGRRVGTTLYESLPKVTPAPPAMTLGKNGAIGANFGPFDGTLEEVRLSQGARYDRDFLPPKELAADSTTLALYHCADGQGERLTDSSVNGRHAKIFGGKWQPARSESADLP